MDLIAYGVVWIVCQLYQGAVARSPVLILDMRMPGLTGLDLQHRLLDMRCPIPVIFASAHADERIRIAALQLGAIAFLSKPFSDQALLDAMRRVFNESQRPFELPD